MSWAVTASSGPISLAYGRAPCLTQRPCGAAQSCLRVDSHLSYGLGGVQVL